MTQLDSEHVCGRDTWVILVLIIVTFLLISVLSSYVMACVMYNM